MAKTAAYQYLSNTTERTDEYLRHNEVYSAWLTLLEMASLRYVGRYY